LPGAVLALFTRRKAPKLLITKLLTFI